MTTSQQATKPRRKRRRGAPAMRRPEKRVLTALIGLRISREDHVAIEWKAEQLGYPSAQHWIRECIKPAVERAKIEKCMEDEPVQAVAASESGG